MVSEVLAGRVASLIFGSELLDEPEGEALRAHLDHRARGR